MISRVRRSPGQSLDPDVDVLASWMWFLHLWISAFHQRIWWPTKQDFIKIQRTGLLTWRRATRMKLREGTLSARLGLAVGRHVGLTPPAVGSFRPTSGLRQDHGPLRWPTANDPARPCKGLVFPLNAELLSWAGLLQHSLLSGEQRQLGLPHSLIIPNPCLINPTLSP